MRKARCSSSKLPLLIVGAEMIRYLVDAKLISDNFDDQPFNPSLKQKYPKYYV